MHGSYALNNASLPSPGWQDKPVAPFWSFMSHSFIAYIDESGDDGLARFREPGQQGGASNWLVISACVMRHAHHLSAVAWRDEISALMPE